MKKGKWILLFLASAILIMVLSFYQNRKHTPTLTLTGNTSVTLEVGESYLEEGFQATDTKGKNISKKVEITDETEYDKVGTYERKYKVEVSGKVLEKKRTIQVEKPKVPIWKEEYQKIDNTKKGWWSGNKKDGTRPAGGEKEEELLKYNAYFLGKDEKVIYLTFDEGSNDTYVKEIMEVLNKYKVQATFFFCRRYILDNPELMRTLVKTGHSVGNHTANHLTMPLYAEKDGFAKYIREIAAVEEAFYSVTGKKMDKVYREPRGDWSFRSLAIVKDLGYKSYFWSADYLDWNGDVTKEYAFAELKKRVHNGAIYLIHPKNKGNYEAMELFIKTMKQEGYSFDLVKKIDA